MAALVYIERVPVDRDAFEQKVRAIAAKYQFDPNWLMIVMRFETAGYFKPVLYQSSGAVGLIQFTDAGAERVGKTKEFLATLTAVQQLDYVDKYYGSWNVTGRIKSLGDCYAVVFCPSFLGKPLTSVVYTKPNRSYELNKPLDIGNKGYITLSDVYTVIERYRPVGFIDTITQSPGIDLGIIALLAGGFYLYKKRSTKDE